MPTTSPVKVHLLGTDRRRRDPWLDLANRDVLGVQAPQTAARRLSRSGSLERSLVVMEDLLPSREIGWTHWGLQRRGQGDSTANRVEATWGPSSTETLWPHLTLAQASKTGKPTGDVSNSGSRSRVLSSNPLPICRVERHLLVGGSEAQRRQARARVGRMRSVDMMPQTSLRQLGWTGSTLPWAGSTQNEVLHASGSTRCCEPQSDLVT